MVRRLIVALAVSSLAWAAPVTVLTDLHALTTADEQYIGFSGFDGQKVFIERHRLTAGHNAPFAVVDLRTGAVQDAPAASPSPTSYLHGSTSEVRSPGGAFSVQQDGDHIELFDRRGRHLRRLAPGRPASYRPAFSPDGKRVIFESYMSDGEYHVTEEKVTGGLKELRWLPSLASPVIFSPDGRWAYLHIRERSPIENQDERECLVRANGATLRNPERLICHETDVAKVSLSLTNGAAVFAASDEQHTVVTRIDLHGGASQELSVPLRYGSIQGLFHDGKRVVLTTSYMITVVDLTQKLSVSLGENPFQEPTGESTGYSVWGIAGGRVIAARSHLHRTPQSTYQTVEEHLVSIDVDEILP